MTSTAAPQGRSIPEWLAPYKNEWRSFGKLQEIIDLEDRTFSSWFHIVKDRLPRVTEPNNKGPGEVKRYLVKGVWTFSLAHAVRLIPPAMTREEHAEVKRLKGLLAMSQRPVIMRKAPPEPSLPPETKAMASWLSSALVSATEPRPMPGVYLLIDEHGKIAYVGQSNNVLARMSGHGDKQFSMVRMLTIADPGRRAEMERNLILLLDPPLNVSGISLEERQARARAAATAVR